MHLLVTRSALDAASLEETLQEMGHETSTSPLIEIEALEPEIDFEGIEALVITSRNAIRCLGRETLERARAIPLFVVGSATGALARERGFLMVIEGPAAARDLPEVIVRHIKPGSGPLLQITGEDQAFDMKRALEAQGYRLQRAVIYRARAAEALSPEVVAAIASREIDGVVLMSPRTATLFSDLATKAQIVEPASTLAYFCLSAAVAQALGRLAPSRVKVAAAPNLQEMLALLAQVAPTSR